MERVSPSGGGRGRAPWGEAIPVPHAAVADAQAGADGDIVAPGPYLLHLLEGGEDVLCLASALALRRLGLDRPDVAVEHRLETLDDMAIVGEAEADEVGEEHGCVGRKRRGWLHGAVSVLPMVGNGGMPSPEHSPAAPLAATLSLPAVRRVRRRTTARSHGVAISIVGLQRDSENPEGKPLIGICQRATGPRWGANRAQAIFGKGVLHSKMCASILDEHWRRSALWRT